MISNSYLLLDCLQITLMYNPKDFIPAKYKKETKQNSNILSNKLDLKTNDSESPWSNLAKETKVPEYRSNLDLNDGFIKNELTATDKIAELAADSQKQQKTFISKKKSVNGKKLTGLLVVFFLVIGVFASYILTKQNQDLRQQAYIPCDVGDPYCIGGNRCVSGYRLVDGECVSNNATVTPAGGCGDHMHMIDGNCVHETCRELANGNIICGYVTDQDPCTEESMGGDWCDDPNTDRVENCEEAGLMRCQCSGGWWVIGSADSCGDVCHDANADCPDCPTTPRPTEPPVNPPPSTPTPTPPPQPLACGEFNCTQNSDCQSGLTCQSVTVNGESKKICSKGENQLFCAADPTTDNCCVSQAMPVCASIEMLDANNNLMTGDADRNLSIGDEVRFRCSAVGNQDVDFDYQFRIWDKSTTSWVNITDDSDTVAKNVSALYTINSFSKYVVQGRICWGNECQVWEIIENSPSNSGVCYGENAVACPDGEICSATPAGGCPTITVDGITTTSACASVPVCRQAEGIDCETNDDCFEGYTCYQPPMPTCPDGMSCAQVMPSKYCTKQ